MTSDLCTDDVVVQITSPQTILPDSGGSAGSPGAGGARGAGGGGAELGRRLLFAARAGDTQTVLDLMAKGAPFTTDWLGTSPLHLAAANAHADTCAVLLRAGVSRDARTKVERTPLHLAAHAGHARVVRLLLEHGANVDCRDMLCMTPLHWAAARGHLAAARELLARGADPRARCKFRKSPRCLALRACAPRIVRLLDDALAQRELAASLPPIAHDSIKEETNENELENVARIQEINSPKLKQQQDKSVRTGARTEARGGGAGSGAEAEALLRRHGITLLPTDDGSTVLSALQSGRTVVLSDAGKLMLKESGSAASSLGSTAKSAGNTGVHVAGGPTAVNKCTSIAGPGGTASGGGGGATSGAGVLLSAKAVKSPPRSGLKVFTLNSLSALGGVPAAPLRKIINPQDLQQVKIVQLPSEAKIMPSKVVSLARAKKKILQCPPVKILMNKSNFEKLIATASKAGGVRNAAEETDAPSALSTLTEITDADLPEEDGAEGAGAGACNEGNPACGCSVRLAAAQRALQRLAAELRAARARLAEYEPR